jgi:hypothetical protein
MPPFDQIPLPHACHPGCVTATDRDATVTSSSHYPTNTSNVSEPLKLLNSTSFFKDSGNSTASNHTTTVPSTLAAATTTTTTTTTAALQHHSMLQWTTLVVVGLTIAVKLLIALFLLHMYLLERANRRQAEDSEAGNFDAEEFEARQAEGCERVARRDGAKWALRDVVLADAVLDPVPL